MEVMQGQQLLGDINNTLDMASEEGLPQATVEDIIKHMQETGIKSPQKAYKDLFETEWLEHQSKKLAEIKRPKGISTITESTAGGKYPIPAKVTKDNLEQVVNDFVNSRMKGQE